jgi:hypothetical protein
MINAEVDVVSIDMVKIKVTIAVIVSCQCLRVCLVFVMNPDGTKDDGDDAWQKTMAMEWFQSIHHTRPWKHFLGHESRFLFH